MFYDEVLEIILLNSYNYLFFFGGGAGNECAYVCSRLKGKNTTILSDLSYYILKFHKEVFRNYSSPLPNGVLACNFNELPFSKSTHQYCAIALLCLHHSESIENIIKDILKMFDQVILLEPMTNPLLRFMSKFGITQRKEHDDWSPARIKLCSFEKLKSEYNVRIKTFIQVPRDYLPFISHKQGKIFVDENVKIQRTISKLYYAIQLFLNKFCTKIRFGNMMLAHISKK